MYAPVTVPGIFSMPFSYQLNYVKPSFMKEHWIWISAAEKNGRVQTEPASNMDITEKEELSSIYCKIRDLLDWD